MKTPPDENDIVRWLDGEMDAAEKAAFEAELAADPALKTEMESLGTLGALLRKNVAADPPVPHADFFNSQIQVRIAQEEMDRRRQPAGRAAAGGGLLDWLRRPWFVAAATAAVTALAIVLWQDRGAPAAGTSIVLSNYTPNPEVRARAFHSDEANATVLMLDGLSEMPAEHKITGHRVFRSETDQEVATTTLFSSDGHVLLVLAKDALDHPRLLDHTP